MICSLPSQYPALRVRPMRLKGIFRLTTSSVTKSHMKAPKFIDITIPDDTSERGCYGALRKKSLLYKLGYGILWRSSYCECSLTRMIVHLVLRVRLAAYGTSHAGVQRSRLGSRYAEDPFWWSSKRWSCAMYIDFQHWSLRHLKRYCCMSYCGRHIMWQRIWLFETIARPNRDLLFFQGLSSHYHALERA